MTCTGLRQPFCRHIDELTDLTWEDEWPECEDRNCKAPEDIDALFIVGGRGRDNEFIGKFICRGCAEQFCKLTGIPLPMPKKGVKHE